MDNNEIIQSHQVLSDIAVVSFGHWITKDDKHKNIYVKEKVDCKNLLTKCQHNSTCNTIITQEQEPERIVEQCIDDPLCLDWLRCKDPRYL